MMRQIKKFLYIQEAVEEKQAAKHLEKLISEQLSQPCAFYVVPNNFIASTYLQFYKFDAIFTQRLFSDGFHHVDLELMFRRAMIKLPITIFLLRIDETLIEPKLKSNISMRLYNEKLGCTYTPRRRNYVIQERSEGGFHVNDISHMIKTVVIEKNTNAVRDGTASTFCTNEIATISSTHTNTCTEDDSALAAITARTPTVLRLEGSNDENNNLIGRKRKSAHWDMGYISNDSIKCKYSKSMATNINFFHPLDGTAAKVASFANNFNQPFSIHEVGKSRNELSNFNSSGAASMSIPVLNHDSQSSVPFDTEEVNLLDLDANDSFFDSDILFESTLNALDAAEKKGREVAAANKDGETDNDIILPDVIDLPTPIDAYNAGTVAVAAATSALMTLQSPRLTLLAEEACKKKLTDLNDPIARSSDSSDCCTETTGDSTSSQDGSSNTATQLPKKKKGLSSCLPDGFPRLTCDTSLPNQSTDNTALEYKTNDIIVPTTETHHEQSLLRQQLKKTPKYHWYTLDEFVEEEKAKMLAARGYSSSSNIHGVPYNVCSQSLPINRNDCVIRHHYNQHNCYQSQQYIHQVPFNQYPRFASDFNTHYQRCTDPSSLTKLSGYNIKDNHVHFTLPQQLNNINTTSTNNNAMLTIAAMKHSNVLSNCGTVENIFQQYDNCFPSRLKLHHFQDNLNLPPSTEYQHNNTTITSSTTYNNGSNNDGIPSTPTSINNNNNHHSTGTSKSSLSHIVSPEAPEKDTTTATNTQYFKSLTFDFSSSDALLINNDNNRAESRCSTAFEINEDASINSNSDRSYSRFGSGIALVPPYQHPSLINDISMAFIDNNNIVSEISSNRSSDNSTL